MKKRAIIVVALAIVLALSFATIATAKYAGYAYNNPVKNADSTSSPNPYPGYLSWTGANDIYKRDTGATVDQATAHGGYVSTTVKCAVCHSTHRAASTAASTAGVSFSSTQLTTAGGCVNCHTAWGAGGASTKIEWANLLTGQAAGPHTSTSFPAGCTSNCHTGGVHGGGNSAYTGMNAYMLGSDKDAAITTAFTNGNVGSNITYTAGGGTGTGANWFQSGNLATTPLPTGADYGKVPSGVSAAQFAAAKGMATGYTCSQTGCHSSSQFAVNAWGYSEDHLGVTSNAAVAPATTMPMTGHGTGTFTGGRTGAGCGPCHPGNAAGGYRTVAPATNQTATAYGCDQCHDMVGQLTNTTAWPHGNRNIDVWQWDTSNNKTATTVASGNLWMYKGDISAPSAGATAAFDPSFTVVKGAAGWSSSTGDGSINDGVCLKCHIPIDSASLTARGVTNGTIMPAGRNHSAKMNAGTFQNNTAASAAIFTWK